MALVELKEIQLVPQIPVATIQDPMPIIVDDHSESLNDVEIQNMSKHDEDAEAIDFFKDKYLKEENDES